MKVIKKVSKEQVKKDTINIVECEGGMCVSINDNDNRYYAKGVSGKALDIKRYLI